MIAERYGIKKEEISNEILLKIIAELKKYNNDDEVDSLIYSYFPHTIPEYDPNAIQFHSASDDFLHALLNAQMKLK